MSKNTRGSAFNLVDVDQILDEIYQDDQGADESPIGPIAVQSPLVNGKNTDALQHVLSNTSMNKDRALQVVLTVLRLFKANQIEAGLKGLDQTRQDTLMKYICQGFERPSEDSSTQLLVWHGKLLAVTGLGSVVRVLTDRKSVWNQRTRKAGTTFPPLWKRLSSEIKDELFIRHSMLAKYPYGTL